ncbi:MAG TPA: hypothetical protein VHU77_01110 [Candidatus Limnocylindria bacterium]|nr:hypothetical protein [Candidatus Limnocylindria bacterium]
MSDPRQPDDGSSWPEQDFGRTDEADSGWSDDDPYRYEPPPRWEPQPFEPTPNEPAAWEPPRFDDAGDETGTEVVEPAEVEEPAFGQPESVEEGERHDEVPPPYFPPVSAPEPMPEEPPQEPEPEPEPMATEPENEPEQEPEPGPEPMAADANEGAEEFENEPRPEAEPMQVAEEFPEPPPEPAPAFAAVQAPAAEEPTVASESSEPVVAFDGGRESWDPKLHGNRRRATTAEQAVPWLIGIILALAGMVIVLLALIFSSPNGLMAGQGSPTASPSPSAEASVQPTPSGPIGGVASGSESAAPSASPEPSVSPTPSEPPTYGALEMVYLGRPSPVAPIYLLRKDFSKRKDPQVLAQASKGVDGFAWAPDGTVGAALIGDRAVALRPDRKPKPLIDNVSALTFGWDADTLYVVRINRDGADDRAHVVQMDFKSGDTKLLATITYKHPDTAPDAALREAQFIDDGGQVRLYAVADGHLTFWRLGAPDTYQVDAADGSVTKITREPTLWSPDGELHIGLHEGAGGKTTIRLRNRDDKTTATTTVTGLVSHVRWAGSSNEIVFTLGVLSAGGGVRQDLYVWDLKDGRDPLPLTSSGAAFGAEWRGVMSNWLP